MGVIGWLEDQVVDTVGTWTFGPIIYYVEVRPHLTHEGSCSKIDDLDGLTKTLKTASSYVDKAKYVPGFDKYTEKLAKYQEGVDAVTGKIAEAKNICSKIDSVLKIRNSIKTLNSIGDIRNDRAGSAKAFGQLLSGVGELADDLHLPYPVSAYIGLLKGADDFFETLRQEMDPSVHIKGDNKKILDADPTP